MSSCSVMHKGLHPGSAMPIRRNDSTPRRVTVQFRSTMVAPARAPTYGAPAPRLDIGHFVYTLSEGLSVLRRTHPP